MIFGKDKKAKAQTRPAAKVRVELETILGANTSLKGDLRSSGSIRIDGDFEGTLDTVGNLIVGEAARVVATISAHNVQIQGTVQGNVTARRIEVLENGKLWGDITMESFALDDGGFFRGKSTMQTDSEPPLLEAPRAGAGQVVDVEATIAEQK